MTRPLVACLILAGTGCASTPPVPPSSAVPPAVRASAAPADTPADERTPAFQQGPYITWGPLPPGTAHAERQHPYDLQNQVTHLRLDWTRHAVVGTTTLHVRVTKGPLSTLAFDAEGMKIASVKGAKGRALRYDYDGHTVTVHTPSALAEGATAAVTIAYEAVRPKQGAYFIDRMHILWTQGETELNRYWIPTYDYPNDKTLWEFYIRTPTGERALSNGRLVDSTRVGGGIVWHWKLEHPASSYLMSMVIGDYAVLRDHWKDVPVDYWVYPDSVQAGWRGFGMTPRAIQVYSDKTHYPYPWSKYDQSVTPDYIFGGMENVTATTQLDNGILHPRWAEPQAYSGGLVAHELGHQWYGDLLTTRTWAHIWLNEGFATFMEQTFRYADQGKDEGDLDRYEAQEQVIAADRNARRPIVYDRWVTDPFELFFSGHIYPKGATILQMLRHQLGDSTFWAAMHRYTVANQFSTVTSADLEKAFEEETGRDFSRFFTDWVYKAGFPVVRVSYHYDDAAKTLALQAREVQPRDSLTGFFDVDVDIEATTEAGPVRGVMQVRGGGGRLTLPLPGAPRAIRWDKGGWLLDITDFPRPTTMLVYQLRHDDGVIGRIIAAGLLAGRKDQPEAVAAVAAAARGDAFWGVRDRAVRDLAGLAPDTLARAALLDATRDADARVRGDATVALGKFPAAPVQARLAELARADSSLYVRGAATQSYAAVAPAAALPVIRAMLDRDSWLDVLRANAIVALGRVDPATARGLMLAFIGPGHSRQARQAAIGSLIAVSQGSEEMLARRLAPLLADEDLFIRQSAAGALGRLGQSSSIPALEARLKDEAEFRVINAIQAAIQRIRGSESPGS